MSPFIRTVVKWQRVTQWRKAPGSRGPRWICITFMWTERPAAASLLGGCCLQRVHTDGCRDWIQIRCLREAELHDNEGSLRDLGHVDPSPPAAARVYPAAEQTERLSVSSAADPWGLFPAITLTSLFNSAIAAKYILLSVLHDGVYILCENSRKMQNFNFLRLILS